MWNWKRMHKANRLNVSIFSTFVKITHSHMNYAFGVPRGGGGGQHPIVHTNTIHLYLKQCCGSGSLSGSVGSVCCGPPGSESGSVSQTQRHGFGSFHHQAKLVRKNHESYCFVTSFWLFNFEKWKNVSLLWNLPLGRLDNKPIKCPIKIIRKERQLNIIILHFEEKMFYWPTRHPFN
jgi:hypothetical protein